MAVSESVQNLSSLETLSKYREEISNPRESTGIGLSNIVQRLRLFYGDDYTITADSVLGEGTVIRISVPDHMREPVSYRDLRG